VISACAERESQDVEEADDKTQEKTELNHPEPESASPIDADAEEPS
jgi:hypothetical protein